MSRQGFCLLLVVMPSRYEKAVGQCAVMSRGCCVAWLLGVWLLAACVSVCVCVCVCVCVRVFTFCNVACCACFLVVKQAWQKLGLARTIYMRCVHGVFGREITRNTVYYGVYIRFWPTLNIDREALLYQGRASWHRCLASSPVCVCVCVCV